MRTGLSVLLLAGLPAFGLDITGLVQDKFANPLPDVKLCAQGSANCVTTDAQGKFHFGGSSALRPVEPGSVKAELAFRRGNIHVTSPAAGNARFQWFDARGARQGARDLPLARGDNAVSLPGFDFRSGAAFLKVSGAGFELTWKLMGSGAPGSSAAVAAKVSAASASLEASKDKYKSFVYVPSQESETGVVIELRPVGDKILFDGKTTTGWTDHSNGSWKVVNGVLEETGGGGVLATNDNYGSFRLVFSSIKLAGSDHNPNILLWCKPGSTDTRTMGGIQFQPPLGHMWDYIQNKDPNGTTMKRVAPTTGLDPYAWSRCEALADEAKATIRFACCMLGDKKICDATEIVDFTDPAYAKKGPIALMIHDGKQKQQYKDIEIEADPIEPDRLLSVKK
jgi:hypothetical protein